MSMNGGYIMIDCAGLDMTKGSTPQTITGLHYRLTQAMATGKPIYAYNCKWGVYPMTPIALMANKTSSAATITCTASTLQVIVTDEDSVTINNMVA